MGDYELQILDAIMWSGDTCSELLDKCISSSMSEYVQPNVCLGEKGVFHKCGGWAEDVTDVTCGVHDSDTNAVNAQTPTALCATLCLTGLTTETIAKCLK